MPERHELPSSGGASWFGERHGLWVRCSITVLSAYLRAAELGDKYGYRHLAEMIIDRGPDSGLAAAEDHLRVYSQMSRRDSLDPKGYCSSGPRFVFTLGETEVAVGAEHSAERLYVELENRLGRKVERVPDRFCP